MKADASVTAVAAAATDVEDTTLRLRDIFASEDLMRGIARLKQVDHAEGYAALDRMEDELSALKTEVESCLAKLYAAGSK